MTVDLPVGCRLSWGCIVKASTPKELKHFEKIQSNPPTSGKHLRRTRLRGCFERVDLVGDLPVEAFLCHLIPHILLLLAVLDGIADLSPVPLCVALFQEVFDFSSSSPLNFAIYNPFFGAFKQITWP